MARRRTAIAIEITEGAIRVRHGARTLTLRPAPPPPNAEDAPDFVILLDDMTYWDAPDDDSEIDIDLLPAILTSIERECDKHGLSVEFE